MDERHLKETIRTEYYHSDVSATKEQQQIVRSLGFTQVGQILELPVTSSRTKTQLATELNKVPHLIRIIE